MSKSKHDMQHLRDEIDRVDTALLDLIAQRMDLAQAVRRAKSGVDVWRPSREESHVRNLAKKAGETAPELVSRIWAELTSASLTIQGPIRLHIAMGSDDTAMRAMVSERFGAAIPTSLYPTASGALAAAHTDPEGVAVLPAPGGMNNWWTALGPNGGAPDMHILAALPRIGAWDWPAAVAVSKAAILPSGDDMTLIYVQTDEGGHVRGPAFEFSRLGMDVNLRAQMNGRYIFSLPEFMDAHDPRLEKLKSTFANVKIIGVLPSPILLPHEAAGTEV